MDIVTSAMIYAVMSVPLYRQTPQPQAPKACAVASVVECYNVINEEQVDHQQLRNDFCPGCDGSELNRALRFLNSNGINISAKKTSKPKMPFLLAYNFAEESRFFTEPSRIRGIRHATCVVGETELNGNEYRIARSTRNNHGLGGHYFINKGVESVFYNLN